MICEVAKLVRDRFVTSSPLRLEMAQRCASLALAEHDQSGEQLQVGGTKYMVLIDVSWLINVIFLFDFIFFEVSLSVNREIYRAYAEIR